MMINYTQKKKYAEYVIENHKISKKKVIPSKNEKKLNCNYKHKSKKTTMNVSIIKKKILLMLVIFISYNIILMIEEFLTKYKKIFNH